METVKFVHEPESNSYRASLDVVLDGRVVLVSIKDNIHPTNKVVPKFLSTEKKAERYFDRMLGISIRGGWKFVEIVYE